MRPFTSTIPFADARRLTLEAARPIERTETLPLAHASGRVVARDVVAATDVPPFDRALMDGYAVRAADTAGATVAESRPVALRARVFAGETGAQTIGPGECVEIATGAPLPRGADAVVMVERTSIEGNGVLVHAAVDPGGNIGTRGGDLRAGAVAVRAGDILTPARLGALAAVGAVQVDVYARPVVSLVSTGDELAAPGQPLGPGQIHDVNRLTMAALVERHGGEAHVLATADDELGDITAVLDQALGADVVVFSGGSSVGNHDLVMDAIGARGRVLYHGIAVRPGKPTALAIVGGTPVFAMPGNPTSCLSNGYLLLVPFLRRTARLPAWEPRTVALPLARAIRSAEDRHQFYTVRIEDGRVEPAFKGSSAITSMADADGYIEIAAGTAELPAGTPVTVTRFDP
ncbi:MAG TPA: gephyrin-like molybdotransferase Glp [Vicinamibacterales bacterium]|nr:gephyrin-like molybdotransferase Glp [Vicinamibacterales bacterium]